MIRKSTVGRQRRHHRISFELLKSSKRRSITLIQSQNHAKLYRILRVALGFTTRRIIQIEKVGAWHVRRYSMIHQLIVSEEDARYLRLISRRIVEEDPLSYSAQRRAPFGFISLVFTGVELVRVDCRLPLQARSRLAKKLPENLCGRLLTVPWIRESGSGASPVIPLLRFICMGKPLSCHAMTERKGRNASTILPSPTNSAPVSHFGHQRCSETWCLMERYSNVSWFGHVAGVNS